MFTSPDIASAPDTAPWRFAWHHSYAHRRRALIAALLLLPPPTSHQAFTNPQLVRAPAALMGTMLLGPRLGRFSKEGYVVHFANASPVNMTLGTFILWLGW